MPLAKEVAAELRKLADSLDKNPEAEIVKPWMTFYSSTKESFTATVRLMPRPLAKRITDEGSSWARRRVEYKSLALDVDCSVPQSLTCELIEPAKPAVYRCDPILSAEEDAELEVL